VTRQGGTSKKAEIRGLTGEGWWEEEVDVFPYLPPTTYYLPSTNHLSFQQHSRLRGLSTFVFIHIPALLWAAKTRSFVFIDIPAMFLHFLKLLQPPLSLVRTTCCPLRSSVQKVLPVPATLKGTSRQAAGSKRRQQGAKQFIIHHSPIQNS